MGGDLLTERAGPLRRLHILLTEPAFRPLKCTFSHGSQWLSSFMPSAPAKETINIYIELPERSSTFHVRFQGEIFELRFRWSLFKEPMHSQVNN